MCDSTKEINLVLFGESGVDKTSILKQFYSGKFVPNCESSKVVQFYSKTIELQSINKSIKFNLWA